MSSRRISRIQTPSPTLSSVSTASTELDNLSSPEFIEETPPELLIQRRNEIIRDIRDVRDVRNVWVRPALRYNSNSLIPPTLETNSLRHIQPNYDVFINKNIQFNLQHI